MATNVSNIKLKKSNVISAGVKTKCKRINVNDVPVWTGSEDLLANAGITNLYASCTTPDSGVAEQYSATLSFNWDDIDTLTIKGYYSTLNYHGGDWHNRNDFKIYILVNDIWQEIWSQQQNAFSGAWDINITVDAESYTGEGAIRCYCSSYYLTDHSIKNGLSIEISSVVTNV